MQSWLTLLCIQLTLFVFFLSWGFYRHQKLLLDQKITIERMQKNASILQNHLMANRHQLIEALNQIQKVDKQSAVNIELFKQQIASVNSSMTAASCAVVSSSSQPNLEYSADPSQTSDISLGKSAVSSKFLSRSEQEILAILSHKAA